MMRYTIWCYSQTGQLASWNIIIAGHHAFILSLYVCPFHPHPFLTCCMQGIIKHSTKNILFNNGMFMSTVLNKMLIFCENLIWPSLISHLPLSVCFSSLFLGVFMSDVNRLPKQQVPSKLTNGNPIA